MAIELYRPSKPSNCTGELPPKIQLNEEQRFIAIEAFDMMSGELFISGAPKETPRPSPRVRPAVRESLERSIREHADVWAELAKS
ncbi:MAG: hypothetical protein H5T64_12305 [Chloroflexi bacterium]|nr:hypothetical protein [Chloroflexota bacterium]